MADEVIETVETEVSTDGSADSSPEIKQDAPDATTESSTDTGVKPSLLDTLMKVQGGEVEETPAETSEKQETETPEPDAAKQQEGDDGKLPFAKHPRFRQLLTQRNEFKAKAGEFEAQVKTLEPKAKHFDELTNYAKSAGFTSEDFSNLLHMGRLMKNDPLAFYEAFKNHWEGIEATVGARLPADLQKKVEDGLIDAETANELARKRGEAELNGQRVQRITAQTAQEREDAQRREQDRQQTEWASGIQKSVSGWESQWKTSDPDYAKKQPRVMREIKLAVYESPPKSVEEALALCDKAKKLVDDEIRQILPKVQGIRTPGSGTSVDAKGQPKTDVDAMMMALEGMGRR